MNAIDYLEKDHHDVLALIEQLEKTTPRAVKTREELFYKIRTQLALHEAVEEQLLYPELEQKDKNLILEAYEEHQVVDKLLEELSETSVGDETWIAKLTVMKESLEHHIKEEREKVFKLAHQLFDSSALKQMAEEMKELKAELQEVEHVS